MDAEHLLVAIAHADPACLADDEFIRDRPTRAQQARMSVLCAECPVFDLCESLARVERPQAGYWAGHLYTPRRYD